MYVGRLHTWLQNRNDQSGGLKRRVTCEPPSDSVVATSGLGYVMVFVVLCEYSKCGYDITVYNLDTGDEVEHYTAGNYHGDSQVYLSPDDEYALSLKTIRSHAIYTAKDTAKEYNCSYDVQRNDELWSC